MHMTNNGEPIGPDQDASSQVTKNRTSYTSQQIRYTPLMKRYVKTLGTNFKNEIKA